MANRWLLKTEPSTYSFDQLLADGHTTWDGVRNALALQHLRQMKRGDRVLVYHSGASKAVVGQAKVTRTAYPDPSQADPRLVVVDLAPAGRLPAPVPLATIKRDPALGDLALVRLSRLSVMPVTPAQWDRLLALAAG